MPFAASWQAARARTGRTVRAVGARIDPYAAASVLGGFVVGRYGLALPLFRFGAERPLIRSALRPNAPGAKVALDLACAAVGYLAGRCRVLRTTG